MTSDEATACRGRFFDYGQAVADYLAVTFAELIRTEYLALRRTTPSMQQQVCMTHAGQAGYTELNNHGVREARDGD